jgi:putative membrane protein insertion efficiency factor
MIRSLPRRAAVMFIHIYQKLVSPNLGANCRYQPTCSSYAAVAIARFGVVRGGWLAMRRIGRCHPLRPGGHDPVPESWRTI